MKFVIRLIPFLIVLGAMSALLALPVMGQTPKDTKVYLPLVAQGTGYGATFSIWGLVDTKMILTLDLVQGEMVSPIFTATSDVNLFRFPAVPLLELGQQYRVSYYNGQYGNPDNPNHLTIWHSFPITQSIPHSETYGGSIIYDPIVQKSPSDGRQYAFTHPVEWHNNGILQYSINIYDIEGELLFTTQNLGTDNEYIFYPLPSPLRFNTPYIWEVMVIGPNGFIGIDEDSRREITFVYLPPLDRPTNLDVSCTPPDRMSSCTFSWDPVPGATEYYVSGPWRVNEVWMAETILVENLYCGYEFDWTVKARNETAEGYWQTPVSVIVPDCPCEHPACIGEGDKEQPEWQSVNEQLLPTMVKD